MAKRLSGDNMADVDIVSDYRRLPAKRPKMFTHETEQFPLCSSVIELEMYTLQAQNKKLADGLLQRQKLEDHLRQQIEKLEMRKVRYDKVVECIGRNWKQVVRSVVMTMQRYCGDVQTVVDDTFPLGNDERSILEEIEQVNDFDLEELVGSWSQATNGLMVQLMHRFSKLHQSDLVVCKLLEEFQENMCNGHASNQGASKLAELINGRDLLLENQKLRKQIDQIQSQHSGCKMQISDLVERVAVLAAEVDRMRNTTADAEAKVEQWICREERYKSRIADLMDRIRMAECQIDSAATNMTEVVAAAPAVASSSLQIVKNGPTEDGLVEQENVGELSSVCMSSHDGQETTTLEDLVDKRDLAEIRLTEVRELTKQLLAAQETIDMLRYQLSHIPDSVIKESPLYRGKCYQLRTVIIELNRFAQFDRNAKRQFNFMFDEYDKFLQDLQAQMAKDTEEVTQVVQEQTETSTALMDKLIKQLEEQIEEGCSDEQQKIASVEPEAKESKHDSVVLNSLKRQLKQLRAESARWRRKYDDSAAQLAEMNKRLEQEYLRLRNSIVIPLENGCANSDFQISADDEDNKEPGELDESDLEDEKFKSKKSLEHLSELKKDLHRCRRSFRKLTTVELLNATGQREEMAEMLAKVMAENKRLRCFVRTGNRTTLANSELERLNKFHEEEIIRLKRQIEECKKEEQTVLVEAESTGQAYDQALEENCALQEQLAQAESSITKHIMQAGRTAAEMKSCCEQLAEANRRLIMMEEKSSLDEKRLQLCQEQERLRVATMRNLQEENDLLAQQLHELSSTTLDVVNKALSLNRKVDSLENELNRLMETDKKKSEMLETERLSRGRLDEQLQLTRKKLEKMKKCTAAGSSRIMSQDEVLCEENRHLKELLTCPSCKVNRKDATLAKCFHVFCSPCLKKRYDTRQRKCPKCAQTFGFNDIKRIFI